jgi:hypothetical protein
MMVMSSGISGTIKRIKTASEIISSGVFFKEKAKIYG